MRSLVLFFSLLALAVALGEDGNCSASWGDQAALIKSGMTMAGWIKDDVMPALLGCLSDTEITEDNKNSTVMCFKEFFGSFEYKVMLESGNLTDSMMEVDGQINECRLRYYGNDSYLDIKEYLRRAMGMDVPDVIQDKTPIKFLLDCATLPAEATALEQLRKVDKCVINGAIQLCQWKKENIGLMYAMINLLQSNYDEPKCTSVKPPPEIMADIVPCIDRARESLGTVVPDEIMKEKDLLTMGNLFAKRILEGVVMETLKCLPESFKKRFLTDEMMNFNATRSAEYLTSFQGWEEIPKERDSIYDAMVECGELLENISTPMEDEGNIFMNNWKEIFLFQECFILKFGNICGVQNNLSKVLFVPFNKELTTALLRAVVETSTKPVTTLMEIARDYFMSD